ncbi:hypothetical protein, conserved [Leishmania tarentolae]|uniref:Uncharacterized protein n=1 Tax=Leishmania tarentolae TaxID=5689 RepID=A0A640KQX0_LEITA|nr:hypothetical protein, conserved [Leishmania tarentolae]
MNFRALMSTHEWVIEQESSDVVTTRVVLDFADGNADNHGSGSHTTISSSSYPLPLRRDGRGRGVSGSTPSGSGVFALKEVTCSEAGSSRRSSKHSNGSCSRRRRHRHLGPSGKVTRETDIGTMAGPTDSAYTTNSLRQRYQRMLFGSGCGAKAAAVSGVARVPTVSCNTSSGMPTSEFSPSHRIDPCADLNGEAYPFSPIPLRGTNAGGQPPSTLCMSAYDAETADEEEKQSTSISLSWRSRGGKRKGNRSGSAGVSRVGGSSGRRDMNGAVPESTAGDTPRHSCAQTSSVTTDSAAPSSSCLLCRVVACEDSDDVVLAGETGMINEDGSYYVLRDVWATRATCPPTITTTRAADFPEFKPLHPISVENEEELTETMTESCSHRSPTTDVRDVLSATAQAKSTHRMPLSLTMSQQEVRQSAKVDAAQDHRRYNKMLLKKERQRRQNRGRQLTGSSVDCALSVSRTQCAYAGDSSRALRDGVSTGSSRYSRGACAVGVPGRLNAYEPTSDSSSDSYDNEAGDDISDTSSLLSLECLSTSSKDDYDVRKLRKDSVFAATVQSLASRAERERKKMEAREEQMLYSEAVQNTTAMAQRSPLHSPATLCVPLPTANRDAAGSPAFAPSLTTALRYGDAAPNGGPNRNVVDSGHAGCSNGVSSFFISPIHESVAAESAAWTAGTGFQFLGQGGLGGNEATRSSVLPTSRPASLQRSCSASVPARAIMSRRRGRSEHNEDSYAEELQNSCCKGALSSAVDSVAADAQAGTHRVRKKRKRGDRARQSVVGECGGSRALRPVSAPSNGPPLEILPCSKVDMREDLLETFLMEAVLDEDDFELY